MNVLKMELCKKIVLKQDKSQSPSYLFGLILSEDENFLKFRTAKQIYLLSKSAIISIESTNRIFKEVN